MNILLAVLFCGWFLLVELTDSTRAERFHEKATVKGHKFHDFSINVTQRSAVGPPVYNPEKDPNRACYKGFFVDEKPPTGFRQALDNIKFICQKEGTQTYYATMYDEKYGIAIYSAYTVERTQDKDHHALSSFSWKKTPGVFPTDVDMMYKHYNGDPRKDAQGKVMKMQRGHLAPAAMFSFDKLRKGSTYRYTNAVPQYEKFNIGQWKIYEERIRCFAIHCPGTLFVLTGTSEAQVYIDQYNTPQAILPTFYDMFPRSTYSGINKIRIPDSMWTAGCCVRLADGFVHGAFAVIGNNDPLLNEVYNLDVATLQTFLDTGVGNHSPEGAHIKLFPGNDDCLHPDKQSWVNFNLRTGIN